MSIEDMVFKEGSPARSKAWRQGGAWGHSLGRRGNTKCGERSGHGPELVTHGEEFGETFKQESDLI